MFDNARRKDMGAGPIPPPPIDPATLAGPRPQPGAGQLPQNDQAHARYAPAPQSIAPPGSTEPTQAEKDWGPWRPKQAQGYNPPDTPEEIEQVLSKYQGPPTGVGMNGGELPVMPQPKNSGRKWFVIVVVIFLALLVAAAVFAYMRFFSEKGNENTNTGNENTNTTVNTTTNINQNTPLNLNAVVNTNAVSNLNSSANTSGNTNTISNLNLNTNASTNTNQATNSNVNSPVNTNVSQAKDSDGDGLTDFLEIIYGTEPDNPDTDGDGFGDYQEIQGGYSPTKGGGARL